MKKKLILFIGLIIASVSGYSQFVKGDTLEVANVNAREDILTLTSDTTTFYESDGSDSVNLIIDDSVRLEPSKPVIITQSITTDVGVVLRRSAICEEFINNSGGTLSTGDIVIVDNSQDFSVTTTTTIGHYRVAGVVVVGGADGSVVQVGVDGIMLVNTFGTVTRGNYLATSALAGTVFDSGSTPTNGDVLIAHTGVILSGQVWAQFIKAEVY